MDSRASLVDLVFAKMTLVYGREFLDRWIGVDLALVKADWANELRHLLTKPQAIRYALERLPIDKPPTVLQFRRICRQMPEPLPALLPPPTYSPEQVVARVASLRALSTRLKSRSARARS